jgi:hypothetical protein
MMNSGAIFFAFSRSALNEAKWPVVRRNDASVKLTNSSSSLKFWTPDLIDCIQAAKVWFAKKR